MYLTIRSDRVTDERIRTLLEAGEYLDDDTLDALERIGEYVRDPEAHFTIEGVDGWYLDEDGHSHYVPAPDPELHQVAAAIYPYGDWAHGGDVIGTARSWLESGEAERMQEWLDAGVFDADAAARLAAVGLRPHEVAVRIECSGQRNTLGYWVANGDISAERAAQLVREADARRSVLGDD